ncbi:MAG: xanthine dehydrogenase accessory factor [Candidatus Krumholzibacteriia bacterium]|jgi:xanthine dehydrogenase accessory factor
MMAGSPKVWLQGGGEMASGTAVALTSAGYRVIIAERPKPIAVRRLVCFSEAVYQGSAAVSGVVARRVAPEALQFCEDEIQLAVDPDALQCPRLEPDVVVDARMTKTDPIAFSAGGCPLIGLGPGFVCGGNASLVIETMRGPSLGAVIRSGSAAPYTGRPGMVGGETINRVLRTPIAGKLQPNVKIGDLVNSGDVVATVSGMPIVSPLAGLVRGLIRPDVELYAGQKVGDVDPRGAEIDPRLQSGKARAIGVGVQQAVAELCRTIISRMQGDSLS